MPSREESQPVEVFGDGTSTLTGLTDPTRSTKPEAASGALPPESFSGRILSHYRVEERLGAGGMGMLYRATDLNLGRTIAIKLLARHLVGDDAAKARFLREARATSALDHPNIATLYEVDEEGGRAVHRDGAL